MQSGITWYSRLENAEIALVAIFLLAYLLYIGKTYRIAKALKVSPRNVVFKLVLRSVYFVLLLIALLGPSFGEAVKEVKSVGKDILIAVDLSQSMNANDVQPSRLEKVKRELEKNILPAFSADRVGVIIFSSEAFMQCPLTYDQSALKLFTSTLNSGLVPSGSTDLSAPLRMIMQKFKAEAANETGKKQTRVAVLISDGEDFGDEVQEAADDLAQEGIRVFTLGLGTEKGSKIPFRNGFKRDKDENEVVTKLNSDALKEIAASTQAKYFEINNDQNEVSRLIKALNLIQGELRDTRQMDVSANKYVYFLSVAFVLMMLDILLTIKVLRI